MLVLSAIPVVLAITAWSFSIANLALPTTPGRFTVGHVVAGLAFICTSLIALVWTCLRQVQKSYGQRDRIIWPWLVIVMGSLSMIWGIVVLALNNESYYLTPGFVMVGLGSSASAFSAKWVCSPSYGAGRSPSPTGCP